MSEFNVKAYAKQIHYDSKKYQFRSGQYLFNTLPIGAQKVVRGKLFDPFYQDMNLDQISAWIEHHLVLSEVGREVIAVFDLNKVLWEKEALDG